MSLFDHINSTKCEKEAFQQQLETSLISKKFAITVKILNP